MKKTFTSILFCFTLLSTQIAKAEPYQLTLLHTNDLHAHLLPFESDGRKCDYNSCQGGFAKIKSFIEQEREKDPNLILLDAGDRFSGTVFYTLRKGKDLPQLMNLMNYDAMGLGNHDFDDGLPELEKFVKAINAPVLSANTIFPENHAINKEIYPALILHKNNQQIGIISLLTPDTKTTSSKADEIELKNPQDVLPSMIQKLKDQGVNIIILLNHIGIEEDVKLAKEYSDVDIIVSAHSHTLLSNNPSEKNAKGSYPVVINHENGKQTLIVSSGIGGHHVGKLNASFNEAGEIVSYNGDTIAMDTSINPDQKMIENIQKIEAEVDQILNKKITTLSENVPLTHTNNFCSESCYIGEVLTDALLLAAKKTLKETDFAFLNAGGIRAGFLKGDITFQNMAQAYPFDSTAVIVKIKGKDILPYLNHGLKEYIPDDRTNPFIQTAGLSYLFSAKEKVVKKIDLSTTKLEDKKDYHVVMPSFLANGGDGFPVLPVVKVLSEKSIREEFISVLKDTPVKKFENRIKKMFD